MNTFTHRADQKSATRAALIAAARRLFVERGYERSTMRELARAAGVATGTAYGHFPDKSTLLAAALDNDIAATLAQAFATVPPGPALAQALHVAAALYRMYARDPALARVLVRESLFLDGEAAVSSRARLEAFLQAMAALLAPGLRPGLDPQDASRAFFTAYFGALVEGLNGPAFDVEAQLDALQRQMIPWFASEPTP